MCKLTNASFIYINIIKVKAIIKQWFSIWGSLSIGKKKEVAMGPTNYLKINKNLKEFLNLHGHVYAL